MVEFEAGKAARLAAELGFWQGGASVNRVSEIQVQERVLPLLQEVIEFAENHELYATRTVREHMDALRSGGHVLQMALQKSSAQFSRSLKDSLVWRTTSQETVLYRNPIIAPASLGEDAELDGIEAVRCYASCRYTAAGFHAMRIAERIARHLIPRAGLRVRKFYPSIDSILSQIEKKLVMEDKRRRQTPKGPRGISIKQVKWLSEVIATFRSVKDAWRNPIGHYKKCTAVEALEIINAARALVRQFVA
jgi:hypothetical protein